MNNFELWLLSSLFGFLYYLIVGWILWSLTKK